MTRSFRNRSGRKNLIHSYDQLETKNLLAGVIINGTAGDDLVTIEYTDKGNIVNVSINGQLTENIDITDGLMIDLAEGRDTVIINSSMGMLNPDTTIEVKNAYELRMLTGNNLWRVNDAADGSNGTSEFEPGMFGSINDSLHFSGAKLLVGGDSLDRFNIHSFNEGTIRGGDGDDIFRFGRGKLGGYDAVVLGEGGDDYFGVHGRLITDLDGGEGFDMLAFGASQLDKVVLEFIPGEKPTWQVGDGEFVVETIRGLTNGANEVSFSAVYSSNSQNEIQWIMNDRLTRATVMETGQSLNLIDFYSFNRTLDTTDRFFIRSTANDVSITGASFIQFSSTNNLATGDLNGIRHQVTITPDSITDAIRYPQVVISNQAGQGNNFVVTADHQITGLGGGGSIQFDIVEFRVKGPMPMVEIYGSDSETDRFIFHASWADTIVHGMGGDDTIMLGGTGSISSSLINLWAPIQIFGGDGADRILVNDHGAQIEQTEDVIREYKIRDQTFSARFRIDGDIFDGESGLISFDDSTEIVRVNGSAHHQNVFRVFPNATNRIVVDGNSPDGIDDSLIILGAGTPGTIINGDGDDGVWLADGFEAIFFYDIAHVHPIAFQSAAPYIAPNPA